ncbi:MAG: hypothetical protein ACPK7O_00855 [Methanobacterium sp.]
MAMFIFPGAIGATDQNAPSNSAIGLNETLKHGMFGAPKNSKNFLSDKDVVKVNAAYKSKKVKAKKVKKVTKKTYKKTKATYKYKKYYKKVRASSSYSRSYYRSSSAGWASDSTIDSIMRSGSKYGYRRGISSASAMQSAGAGDCWAMSEYLNSKFRAAGYNSRVIQYATKYSSRHRSVQLYQNGKWVTVPYRAYGYNGMFV